jgi:transcriptional regulator with PAS, ATPase and Fis domain
MQGLMAYDWPGNVRELENLVERACCWKPSGGHIELQHLFPGVAPVTAHGAVIDREKWAMPTRPGPSSYT